MALRPILPSAQSAAVNAKTLAPTTPWNDFFRQLRDSTNLLDGIQEQINALKAEIDALEDIGLISILGPLSVKVDGSASFGYTLRLMNDEVSPGNDKFYGTDESGAKGFHNLPPPSFVPYFIPDDENFTIPLNKQALWAAPIDLGAGASITIDGAFIEVD